MTSSLDVARLAGVSQSAVSRVFTPGASVSARMRDKVLAAATALGYRPNVVARSLTTGRSRIIGLVVAYLDNQYYPVVVERLSKALQARGYHVLMFMTEQTASNIDDVLAEILDHQVDGIVAASVALSSPLADRCTEAGVPVVLFNRVQAEDRFSSVTSDNAAGGRLLARFLLAGGHRRIAYIAGWEGASTQRDREAGFRAGLAEGGGALFARDCGDYAFAQAEAATRRMFAGRGPHPDALFVCNDHMTIAAMDVLRHELGRRVPADVSVVSYDDVPQAAWRSYDITSVQQPTERMVAAVVDTLTAAIERGDRAPHRICLQGRLVLRSSARVPAGWNRQDMTHAQPETRNKIFVMQALAAVAEATPSGLQAALARAYHPDAEWRGAHPLNEMRGVEAIAAQVWRPLQHAFPDLERRELIVAAGAWGGADYVATVGHYCGSFRQDWLTIPATGRPIALRSAEVHRMQDGRIAQSTVLIDVLDVIRQAGFWPIAPSLGTELQWPPPIGPGAISLAPSDPAQSAANLAQTLAMHVTLGDYNDEAGDGRQGLLDMPQKQHWHPRMMWYGPCGIGTTRGLQGFVDYHQLPFRVAFPNRRGGNHYIRIGDGPLSVTGGWPSVHARHLGGDFCGSGPTGRDVTMRVMDFYYHHEGLIRENWVPIDMIHLLLQMDVDVFARMRSLFRRGALA